MTTSPNTEALIARLIFDAARCEMQFSKGVASNIEEAVATIATLTKERDDFEQVFKDACDEAKCRHDNEALLEAISGMKAELARLREANEWRTIDSAPIDGTEIWAWNGIEQARMLWLNVDYSFPLWIWADEALQDIDPQPEQPTHWRPLPPAPTESSTVVATDGGGDK